VFFHLESTHQVGFCGFTPDKNLEDKRLTMERSQATNFSAYFKKYLYKTYSTCAIKNLMKFFYIN